MQCHEVDYEIFGSEMQIVEVELDPGETVIAEAGGMNYMEDGIAFEAKMGDGSEPDKGLFGKLLDVGKRALTGERFEWNGRTIQVTPEPFTPGGPMLAYGGGPPAAARHAPRSRRRRTVGPS